MTKELARESWLFFCYIAQKKTSNLCKYTNADFFLKKLKKGVDIPVRVCYNVDTERERNPKKLGRN